jgi:hypothetical protein
MIEKKLTPARARALIISALNDGYRASQVKNIDKVKAVPLDSRANPKNY